MNRNCRGCDQACAPEVLEDGKCPRCRNQLSHTEFIDVIADAIQKRLADMEPKDADFVEALERVAERLSTPPEVHDHDPNPPLDEPNDIPF